jgi:hypothetical protein
MESLILERLQQIRKGWEQSAELSRNDDLRVPTPAIDAATLGTLERQGISFGLWMNATTNEFLQRGRTTEGDSATCLYCGNLTPVPVKGASWAGTFCSTCHRLIPWRRGDRREWIPGLVDTPPGQRS